MKSSCFCFAALLAGASAVLAQINTVQTVATGVYFHEGDPRRGHSNNGWIVFDDFVLVIDANYPSGAKIVMPQIAATTAKPVRFVFDTHHHGDHAYGNQLWAEGGATLVASTRALEEMKQVETGFFGSVPGRWEGAAKNRPDVAATKLKPPVMLFPKDLFLDDGQHRVELKWFGTGHTKGDAYAWLPKEKILFTGDLFFNRVCPAAHQGTLKGWAGVGREMLDLDIDVLVPGHGPLAGKAELREMLRYLEIIYVGARKGFELGWSEKRAADEAACGGRAIDPGRRRPPRDARRTRRRARSRPQPA